MSIYYNGTTKKKVLSVRYGSRKLFCKVIVNALPSAFQEVEYIESTGTQYIDTGIKPTSTNPNFIAEIDFSFLSVPASSYLGLFGVNGNMQLAIYSNYKFGDGTNISNLILELNKKYSYKGNFASGKSYVDGTEVAQRNNSVWRNAYLFAVNGGNDEPTSNASGKIYSCKIYDNGTLVRNYIPCYRKVDNVIGLYDLVNGVFYTNAGEGTFDKGGDV